MDKKIICILVSMLMCATTGLVAGTETEDEYAGQQIIVEQAVQNRDMWDVQFSYDVQGASGSQYLGGAGFDGTYFYAPEWNSGNIHKFNKTGAFVETFTISGVTTLRDLAYDGEFFYGGNAAGLFLWQMNFTSKTLVSTITLPVAARSCAYDYEKDAFWVNVWSTDLILYSRQGVELNRITAPESLYGSEFDNNTKISGYAGPFLWVFTGTSTGVDGIIKAYDIATKALTTMTHNVAQELGAGIAGGLFTTKEYVGGTLTLGGICQGTANDYLFGYELSITNLPPNTPGAPSGQDEGVTGVEYTFTATTTDPEGDPIEYWFEFGDGQNSGWVSPGNAKHIWTTAGTFDVTVKARDAVHGGESAFSPPHQIEILGGPVLKIKNVKGGLFRIKATIENNGGTNATGVEWTISLAGGAILGKESNGTVDIPKDGKAEIQSKLVFGFGKTVVTVTATCPESSDSVTRNGIVILFFTYVRAGG